MPVDTIEGRWLDICKDEGRWDDFDPVVLGVSALGLDATGAGDGVDVVCDTGSLTDGFGMAKASSARALVTRCPIS